jgi:choline monooxygenase
MLSIDKDITAASTLPGEFYGSPEYFELCKNQLFTRSWQLVGDANTIKIPLSVYPFSFMEGLIDEPLLLARNKEDELFCMSNVCTHRGNILVEHAGTVNGNITCSYHGRKFGIDGCFKTMPECEHMQNFPSESDNLPRLDVKKWGAFLFTSINPAFDFEAIIREMNERVGWMPLQEFVFDPNRSREYLVQANWALYCDNYLEGFHIPFIHKDLAKSLDYSNYSSEIYQYSNLQLGISKGGEACFDLPPESPDYGKEVAAYYYWVFPNMMFNFYPWGLSVNIVKPIKPDMTKVEFRSYVWDESKIDSGAGAILDRVEREDEAVVENVQRGTTSMLYKKGRFSPKMEKGVHHFHSLIAGMLNEEQ